MLTVSWYIGTLIVTILEVNENPPRFIPPWTPELPYYTLTIPERQPPGTYVTTMVTEPNVNIVRYFLTNDSLDEFNIVTDTGRFISLLILSIPAGYKVF